MGVPSQALPSIGSPNSTEDSKVRSCLSEMQTILTAGVDATNLTAATNGYLGLTDSSVRRGKSIIATQESRTNTSYGLMTTPDQVTGLVLPTDGLIAVCYKATWYGSATDKARAAIFVGANQLKVADANASGAPATQEALARGANIQVLSTFGGGLATFGSGASYTGDVTTGQAVGVASSGSSFVNTVVNGTALTITPAVGGPCFIFASAGTYDISVQFKDASGAVTVSNRKLWVWTMGF